MSISLKDIEISPLLSGDDRIAHAFFTRRDGQQHTINYALSCGGIDRVRRNRYRAMAFLGADALVVPRQEHGVKTLVVESAAIQDFGSADAVVTSTPGLAIGVVTADCGPILLADSESMVVGVVHAGWRGASHGVIEGTLESMVGLGARRSHILAALGPTIGQESYKVGSDWRNDFLANYCDGDSFFIACDDDYYFDLPRFIVVKLVSQGVQLCRKAAKNTYTDPRRFFSYRYHRHHKQPDNGRQLSAIVLRKR